MPLPDGDAAIDYGAVHRTPETHGAKDGFGVIEPADKLQPPGIHQKEVGALADGKLADILPAQESGAAAYYWMLL